MAHTTLLAKFRLIYFLISFILAPAYARESFEFDLGEKINILSDKAFRRSSQNEFEAVGNVVITHLKNTIYGEKAKINFTTGEVDVIGNVRYISPDMTLYGARLNYNFISKRIDLENARIISDNYIITGKKIIQDSPNRIEAFDAEYTTCKDCPESWSIYGKKIKIDIGKYIYLTNAFIKIKGVIAMYIPYIVFPIKQKRESGVLFPFIDLKPDTGFSYQQPFFIVIDDYKDMTLTPSTFGTRGLGGEFQYRHNVGEKTWFEMNSLIVNDEIYSPFKLNSSKSNKKELRYFSDLESHFAYKQYINGHIYINNNSDLDTIRDLDFFAKEKIRGTEVGAGGFVEGRNSLFSLTAQSYYTKNLLFGDPQKFDNQYVQILPKLNFSSIPYNLFHSQLPFLKNISTGFNADYTIFKQNKIISNDQIRNARRLNMNPYLDWKLGRVGPVFFSTQAKIDYQKYFFPNEVNKTFSKQGVIYESEAKIELEKVYGLSYVEEVPTFIEEEKEVKKDLFFNADKDKSNVIGSLPKININNSEQIVRNYNNSYRHSQEFKLKHYLLDSQKFSGNVKFRNQIENDDGQFDYVDAIRDREHISNQTTPLDSLPLSNTLELQWNSTLIKKTSRIFDPKYNFRYLKDNFDYSELAQFKLSQGIDLTVNSPNLIDKLTRLYGSLGFSLNRFTFGLSEYYSHKTTEHNLSTSLGMTFDQFIFSNTFSYNSFNSKNTPVTKLVGYSFQFNLTDLFTIQNSLDYNIESRITSQTKYSVIYSPLNKCWKLELNLVRNLIEEKVGLLFYINYNDNNFTSFNVR